MAKKDKTVDISLDEESMKNNVVIKQIDDGIVDEVVEENIKSNINKDVVLENDDIEQSAEIVTETKEDSIENSVLNKEEKITITPSKIKIDNKIINTILNGIVFENPTFVMMLGMCPTLAVTTSLSNALGMGIATTFVLVLSNFIISLLRNFIPNQVRIPSYIVIVASFVTMVQLIMQAYFVYLYNSLGIYIPLIVVNCIILGRAESFASKNNPILSIADGLGMGVGFTFGISIIGIIRELIGSGTIFSFNIIPENFQISMFVLAPGAFLVLAFLVAIQNKIKLMNGVAKEKIVCDNDCMNCGLHNNKEHE